MSGACQIQKTLEWCDHCWSPAAGLKAVSVGTISLMFAAASVQTDRNDDGVIEMGRGEELCRRSWRRRAEADSSKLMESFKIKPKPWDKTFQWELSSYFQISETEIKLCSLKVAGGNRSFLLAGFLEIHNNSSRLQQICPKISAETGCLQRHRRSIKIFEDEHFKVYV